MGKTMKKSKQHTNKKQCYKESKYELELLVRQRDQLVEALAKTNSNFIKTIFLFLTGIITLSATSDSDFFIGKSGFLKIILIQVVLLLILFTAIQLLSGNIQRYYIAAIDQYIKEKYGIHVLFYQGAISLKHTVGLKGRFHYMTTMMGVFFAVLFIWVIYELNIYEIFKGNIILIILTCAEIIFLMFILFMNHCNKRKGSQEFLDCIAYLKGEKEFKI